MGSPPPNLSLQQESRNGVTRIAVAGELDMASAPTLAQSLTEAEREGTHAILLDLRDLAFIDSSGLYAILSASTRARANGHRLVVDGSSGVARRLFELTGTEFLVEDQEFVSVLDRFTGGQAQRASQTSAIQSRPPTHEVGG
jgi:anti-anti-sigma factor